MKAPVFKKKFLTGGRITVCCILKKTLKITRENFLVKSIYSAESTRDPVKVQMSQKTRYRCCFNGRKYFTNIFSNTAEQTPLDHTFEPPKFRHLSCYVNRTVMKSTFLPSNPDFNLVVKAKTVFQIIFNILQAIKNSSFFRFP